ncbi:MAG: hypothetical protein IJ689_05640 [Alphaproteobacteria bacterium]|nr:hypothetical protein [Alphaproteobacteria bacterium]
MNKYILLLGIAGVALGSYCAYADNSATMIVTARIEHDVSLVNNLDLNLGTIIIDPAAEDWSIGYNYTSISSKSDSVIDPGDVEAGQIVANIPNPSACDTISTSCGGLSLSSSFLQIGSSANDGVSLGIVYDSSQKVFYVVPINFLTTHLPREDDYSKTITISYNAG